VSLRVAHLAVVSISEGKSSETTLIEPHTRNKSCVGCPPVTVVKGIGSANMNGGACVCS
jgi:hypothetical protein